MDNTIHLLLEAIMFFKNLLYTCACLALSAPVLAAETPLKLIALGDMPYGNPEKSYPPYEALISAINLRNPDLVIHVGDTKGGGACTDEILTDQLNYMNSFETPVLYTPGDNEWADCPRFTDGVDDPLERLGFIRKTYFSEPDKSLGKQVQILEHQAKEGFPENARFTRNGISFITAHIVGSNNNLQATGDMATVAEFFKRSQASTDWLVDSFELAATADIVVVAIHADMFEYDFNIYENERWLRHSGFAQFGPALQKSARKFGKPVLLIFGDSHEHRVFQPFPKFAPNVTALEVYGYRDVHAVEIIIDPKNNNPFNITTVWNPAFQ